MWVVADDIYSMLIIRKPVEVLVVLHEICKNGGRTVKLQQMSEICLSADHMGAV